MSEFKSTDQITDEQREFFEKLRDTYSGTLVFPLKGKRKPGKKNKPRNIASRRLVKRQ